MEETLDAFIKEAVCLMKVALITAIFGGYDHLKPLPPTHGFDEAICVTDYPYLSASGWTTIVHSDDGNPRLAAKEPKMQPHKYVDADVWVWVDGQIQVKDNLADFAVEHLDKGYVAAFAHPERDCLYEEARVCKERGLASPLVLNKQVKAYRQQGMPQNFGLWECAVLAWSPHGLSFGAMWLEEIKQHSLRDQISFPFITWAHNTDVRTLPGHSRNNPYTAWTGHRRR